jgi:predicted dehydrogenase
MSELEFQVRRFHGFLWAGAGFFTDWCIHHVDHLSWMKDAWPVKAQALGSRHYRMSPDGSPQVDQNLDTYAVEYTYADGTRYFHDARCIGGAAGIYSSYVHGSKGLAIASRANDCGTPSAIYRGQNPDPSKLLWQSTDASNPYQNEWDDLLDAIRSDRPYNEVKRGVEASLVACMGRMAAHTGQEITFEQMLNCEHEFAPGLDKLTVDSPAPLHADSGGRYPVPQPGITTAREY